jgi:hypothetical protein
VPPRNGNLHESTEENHQGKRRQPNEGGGPGKPQETEYACPGMTTQDPVAEFPGTVSVFVEGHLDDESPMRGRERDGETGAIIDVRDGMILS